MNKDDITKIKQVIDMLNGINDIEMEEIIEYFNEEQTITSYYTATLMEHILNGFNQLVYLKYMLEMGGDQPCKS
jgi:hypothetical protein